MKRRDFVGLVPSAALLFSGKAVELNTDSPVLPISCNVYNWMTFYQQAGKAWGENWDDCMREFSLTKIPAIEPSISDVRELNELIPYLEKYQIRVPSIFGKIFCNVTSSRTFFRIYINFIIAIFISANFVTVFK